MTNLISIFLFPNYPSHFSFLDEENWKELVEIAVSDSVELQVELVSINTFKFHRL